MKLAAKGAKANVEAFEQLKATMSWTSAVDFDLAAIVERKDGTNDIIYFDNLGDLNVSPFIKHSGDEGIAGNVKDGGNKEVLTIAKLTEGDKIHLAVWDYSSIEGNKDTQFANADLKLSLVDNNGKEYDANMDVSAAGDGNFAILATIDNSGMVPEVINQSVATKFTEGKLPATETMLAVLNG